MVVMRLWALVVAVVMMAVVVVVIVITCKAADCCHREPAHVRTVALQLSEHCLFLFLAVERNTIRVHTAPVT